MFYYIFILACLVGCSDSVLTKIQIDDPDILVHPESLDFQNLESGEETGTSYFSIVNVGTDVLSIDAPKLIDQTNRFIISDIGSRDLQPGEVVDVEVYYNPQTYEDNEAYVEIVSNDKEDFYIEVPIKGMGDAPVITLDPEGYDFGTISMGCDNELRLTIGNDGNLPLDISSIQQMVTQPADINMSYGTIGDPPWVIDPGQELDLITSYTPSDIGVDSSIITIDSNDPLYPSVDFDEVGEGQVEEWITDSFEQEEIPLLDILWVIDNSGSMSQIQNAVASNMTDFMNVFLAASPDYHMGFITTDSPAFVLGTYLDASAIDPASEAAIIIGSVGVNGSANEKGIYYAYMSTDNVMYAGAGSTFLRADATLVIIYVSDEPDYSTGTWASYTSHFDNLKTPDKLHMVAVVPDQTTGCTWVHPQNPSYSRYLSPGDGYLDIVKYYSGDFYSICAADWGAQMQDLADTVSVKRQFSLSEDDPIEETIKVYVNGQEAAEEAVEYNNTDNIIQFADGLEPDPGDTIEIVYATWGCD
jgi:hypothetical protein